MEPAEVQQMVREEVERSNTARQARMLALPGSVTPLRTLSQVFPAGVVTAPVSGAGLRVVSGIVVVAITPSAHFSFSWFPRAAVPDIVVNNLGASQTIAFTYYVVGSV